MDEHPVWWIRSDDMNAAWIEAVANHIAGKVPVEQRSLRWTKWFSANE